MSITALVTLCDISSADLILGQPAIGEKGIVMEVRNNKVTFVKEAGVEDPFKGICLEDEGVDKRYHVILEEDVVSTAAPVEERTSGS